MLSLSSVALFLNAQSGFLFFLIFTTRVDPINGSIMLKLILFEKSRVELEFVFQSLRQESGNTLGTPVDKLVPQWAPEFRKKPKFQICFEIASQRI